MKSIKFDCNGRHAPAYTCSEPGDNSGRYVLVEVAEELLEALAGIIGEIDDCAQPADWEWYENARAAIAKARGK